MAKRHTGPSARLGIPHSGHKFATKSPIGQKFGMGPVSGRTKGSIAGQHFGPHSNVHGRRVMKNK